MTMTFATLNLENSLLIATPAMQDSRFHQAVIYIVSHDEKGAMGIVLNHPKTLGGGATLHLTDLLEQVGVEGAPKVADTPVLVGGPVDIERGFVLHTRDFELPEGTLSVSDTLALSTTRDVLNALVTDKAPEKAVLAIGYAGWGDGQIEKEIANNAWIVCTPEADGRLDEFVFEPNFASKWADALAEIGIDPASLAAVGGSA